MKFLATYKKLSSLSCALLSSLFLLPQGSAIPVTEELEEAQNSTLGPNLQMEGCVLYYVGRQNITIKRGTRISGVTFNLGNYPQNSLTIEEGVLNFDGTRRALFGPDIRVVSIPGQIILYDFSVPCDLRKSQPEDDHNNNQD